MIYLIIIMAYFLIMVITGVFSRRMSGTVENFFVAGRRGSTVFITGSLLATILGGSATIGVAGLSYSRGLTGIWWLLAGSIGLVVLGLFLAGRLRKYALFTLPQLVQKQYGTSVSIVTSVIIVIAWVGVIAGQIVATGKILAVLGMGSPLVWMVVFTLVFVGYTLIGGQAADIRTDFIQAILIFAGIFSCLAIVLAKLGGWSGLVAALPATRFEFPLSDSFSTLDLVSYLLLIGLVYVVGPDIYSRLFCSRDAKTARRAAMWTALLLVPFALGITVMGMGAAALFPGILPEDAFPVLVKQQLPPLAGGLVLAGLVSATMSSADSCVMSSSTILTLDIIKRIKPSLSEHQVLIIAKWSIVLLGILALLLALVLQGVINALLFAYTIYTGGVILPVLFGFFKDRLKLTWTGAMAAVIGGGLTALVSKFAGVKYLDLGSLVISVALLFIVSFAHNQITRRKQAKGLR
jgi:solute:Na+ symporter, SSS family